ncbi:MAG: DUF4214 domain-containing protein [Ramlibacter sp.]|nr:DUF4214 domain-containing protein [Ramlibacter sp.]
MTNGQYSLNVGLAYYIDFQTAGGYQYRDLFEARSTIGTYVPPPVVSIDTYTGSSPEDGGGITITLTRSGTDIGLQSTVLLSTQDGAATSSGVAKDFNAVTEREVVFAPGVTSVTVTLGNLLIDDQAMEVNENFGIRIFDPVNASLGFATGNVTIIDNDLTGTSGANALTGGAGGQSITGGAGNDSIDGGAGIDTALYGGGRGSYTITSTATGYTISANAGTDGTDSLLNVERLQFAVTSVNLTVGAIAHTITEAQLDSLIELYIAYINRVPDADGMVFWIGQLGAGQSLDRIGEAFYGAAVQFGDLTGYSASMSDADFVTVVYRNVLGRSQPDAGGLAFWSNELASGHSSRGTLVSSILGSAHSFKGRADFGYVADLLDNKIAVGKTFAIDQGLVYNTSQDSITQGMAIAAAVTPTSTAAAITLIGVSDGFSLY